MTKTRTLRPHFSAPIETFHRGRGVQFLIVVLIWFAFTPPANAAEISWNSQPMSLVAKDENLSNFLQRFFARINLPVQTSPRVTGRVSGTFNESAEILFNEIAKSYGLAWYYDGAKMFVYSLTEIESRLVKLEPETARRFPVLLNNLRVADAKYPITESAEEGYFLVAGPPRYVERVVEVAEPGQMTGLCEVAV